MTRAGFRSLSVSLNRRHAFTLVEVLLSLGIIALLLAVALPTLGRAMSTARSFRCQVAQRSVAFDFAVFANDDLGPDRGNDAALGNRFHLETFQESQYGIDEFWRYGEVAVHELPDDQNNDPMRCAEVAAPIRLRRDKPCASGGVTPATAVSFGFNTRLHRRLETGPDGVRLEAVLLNSSILEWGMVPLFWDVDGAVAASRSVNPVFSAPPLADSADAWSDGASWFPAARHNSGTNVAFIDGHVESAQTPLDRAGWLWAPPTLK